jgi:RimJ/RimL family protein N-acetyltransferase
MPEAPPVLSRFELEDTDLNRTEAATLTQDQRSQRVFANLGFRKEGLWREYLCRYGTNNDQVQFSLPRRE